MKSMTGFGRGVCTIGGVSYRLELRTLNSRFLDLRLRFPWNDAEVEAKASAVIRQTLARGRVDLSVGEQAGASNTVLKLDEAAAKDLGAALQQLATLTNCDLKTAALLLPSVPDLLRSRPTALSSDEIWAPLSLGLQAALEQLVEMRQREGQSLRADILGHLDRLDEIVALVSATVAGDPQAAVEQLEQRLAQLVTVVLDPARIAQEAAIIADRADISEELTRLRSHSEELRRMLDRQEPTGRALEFMMQEVNRELNTVASKTSTTSVTTAIVEGKGLVEKMREQVQNVE